MVTQSLKDLIRFRGPERRRSLFTCGRPRLLCVSRFRPGFFFLREVLKSFQDDAPAAQIIIFVPAIKTSSGRELSKQR